MTHHVMKTSNHIIPDWLPPGMMWYDMRTAPPTIHQDGGVKYANPGASSKIPERDNIIIGTWNTKTLRAAGKLQELTHKMDRYRWNFLGLCEMRWKNFGETTTDEGHKIFFSRKEDKLKYGTGLLFLFTRISWTLSWDVVQSPAGSSPSA